MPSPPFTFGKRSLHHLTTLDPQLQAILREAIRLTDFTIIEGYRSHARQQELLRAGRSQAQPGQSLHNQLPSHAVDLAPYPVDWHDRERFCYLAGVIIGIAHIQGVCVRWGADWNRNGNHRDTSFVDMPHFELVETP